MKIKIVSKLVPWRGNSWNFENPTERVYAEVAEGESVEEAMAFANDQYEKMGWQKCFVEPPVAVAVAE